MMKFGGSTFSFMWQEPAIDSMRRIRKLGLNDFDILAAPGHLWPEELSSSARSALLHAMQQDGICIDTVNYPPLDYNLCSCVRAVREFAVARYIEGIHLTAELGARGVVVVPGRVAALFPPKRDDTARWLYESLEKLLKVAEEANQILFLETHPHTSVPTAKATAELISDFEHHPRLQVAYDVASAEFIGEDQSAALRLLAPCLGQVHLSDGTRSTWRHDRAGLGSVNFRACLDVLEEIQFSEVSIIEVISTNPINDIEQTLDYLQKLAHRH